MALSTLQRREAADVGEDQFAEDIRLVLIGKTGSGKSKTGNTILGSNKFKSAIRAISITQNCQLETVERFGSKVMVIDTPGIFDTNRNDADIVREIGQCITLSSPGPHAFLYVIAIERITKEVCESIDFMQKVFGQEVFDYTIVLFTKEDDLMDDHEEDSVEDRIKEYIDTAGVELRMLLRQCCGRYIVFNNKAKGKELDEYATRLLDMVKELKHKNKEGWYTNALYKEAEELLQQEIERRRHEIDTEVNRQVQEIRNRITNELESHLWSEIEELKRIQREVIKRLKEDVKNSITNKEKEDNSGNNWFKSVLHVCEKWVLPLANMYTSIKK